MVIVPILFYQFFVEFLFWSWNGSSRNKNCCNQNKNKLIFNEKETQKVWWCQDECGSFLLPSPGEKLSSVLPLLHPECHSLPEANLLPGQLSHGAAGIRGGKVRWLAMAFESVSCFSFIFSVLPVLLWWRLTGFSL